MKCNCGRELKLPATYIGNNKQGIPRIQYKCICGWSHEVLLDTLLSYTAERSGNVNLSKGEYFQYKNGKVKFSCPLCKRFQFIKDPDIISDGEKTLLNITCENDCSFKTDVILKDWE